jgi:putative SOS response-associated peptidase YedK
MAFAGLWEGFRWPDETVTRTFTIMTTTPNAEMAELHNRMPVILEEADWPVWLGDVEGDHAALLRPAEDGLLRTWPVNKRVGSPRNNDAELIKSITDAEHNAQEAAPHRHCAEAPPQGAQAGEG